MKIFRLRPDTGGEWLAPADIVERLRAAFDHADADEEEGREYAAIYVSTYQRMLEAGVGAPGAAPVEAIERQWRDAVVVRARDDGEATAPFEALLRREYRVELRFAAGTHFKRRQRTAQKAAAALGYVVDCAEG
jgi:hypothetical protein